MGAGGPTPEAGPAAPGVAGACRQRYVEIDDCQIQNPAYSLAHTKRGPGSRRDLFWCVRVQDQRSWTLLIPMAQGTPPGFPAHTLPSRCEKERSRRSPGPLFLYWQRYCWLI